MSLFSFGLVAKWGQGIAPWIDFPYDYIRFDILSYATSIKTKWQKMDNGMEVHASAKHSDFFILLMQYWSATWNCKVANVLLFSSQPFCCKKVSFWSDKQGQIIWLCRQTTLVSIPEYIRFKSCSRYRSSESKLQFG